MRHVSKVTGLKLTKILKNTKVYPCLLLAIMCSGEKWNGGGSSSRMSPDFLPQEQMHIYVYENAVGNDMHNIM